jgi:hypothetical protein
LLIAHDRKTARCCAAWRASPLLFTGMEQIADAIAIDGFG